MDVLPDEQLTDTVPIAQLVLLNGDAVPRRLNEMLQAINKDKGPSSNDVIILVSKGLKLTGQHVFNLDDKLVFAV